MEVLVVTSLLLNGVLGTILWIKLTKKEEIKKEPLAVKYYEEIRESVGLFKKEKSVCIKAQLLYEGIPVGQSFTVCEHKSSEVDRSQLNKTLEDLARPLIKVGIKAILP